ncbi:FAD-dependent oxidoreductase [Thermoproteus tenax]|uniref:NADH oxidase n=1 Tax=Thermoproteus tenax (strain ATCC 35583 / DSM 2078 / JCM 9277 / NBRC 100435 / Kra 1) TaxID=768679 RepID=G4RKG2_THETK|nr:FAD-dependent oxidoreductase [Thermoproteus tenax]CCC82057.1 NADH oxidase [Thermoproteus tenax Kra 1]
MARIVIVGGGAAGASAAARARRLDPNAEITMIEAGGMITHAPCGIPYAVSGVVADYRSLMTYTPEEFEKERNIRVLTHTKAVDVDVDKRTITISRGGREEALQWDKLVIATGARPLVPKIPGVELSGVLTVRLPDDVPHLRAELDKATTVGIIGGGYIGVEMAEAALRLGKKVVLFEMMDRLLPAALDSDMSAVLAEEMRKYGVDLHLGERVVELKGSGGVVSAVLTERGEYRVDKVILAVGVRPDVELATKAGVKLGETGAVNVNEYMETSVPDVYAAGDVAEKVHRLTGRRVWIPLAPSANKEGQVAGGNAAKGRVLKFPGIVGTAATKFFDLYIARTGLSEFEAQQLGIKYEKAVIKARTKAQYYPGYAQVHVKMLAEQGTGRILGVQVLGWDHAVVSYADISAIAIERGATIEDMFFADISYMPATAPVWHPLIVAARVLSRGKL